MSRLPALILFIVAISVTPALAQDQPSDIHQSTTTPSGARFEIVQSEVAAKWTFRLDRFAGHVFQLVRTTAGDYTWEEMTVAGRTVVAQPSRARFQIFTSGIAAKFTFLIDGDTGKTWQLIATKETLADGSQED